MSANHRIIQLDLWTATGYGKSCNQCGVFKCFDQFYKRTFDGKSRWARESCKSCQAKARKAWGKKNQDQITRKMYARSLQVKYGITLEAYETMLANQNGLCAICRQPETQISKRKKIIALAVDHDHKTGQIRGLLCQGCNFAVGWARDNPDVLKSAARYIEQTGQ